LTARNGWLGLAAGVIAFEVACPQGETLSEGVDRALEHPTLRYAAIGAVALTAVHLLNVLPERRDPFHYALLWKQPVDNANASA
jgi:hypothetical protein